MKDIFISYKSEDIEKARAVRDHLESEGLSVWMAPDSITGGASYAAEIPPAIDGAKVFLLVFTKNTQNSKWVSRELDRAINGNKIIIPLMLDDCLLNDEFSFYLTNVQRYPAFENYDKSLKKMTDEIKRYIAPQVQEAKTEIKKVEIPKPPKPKKEKRKKAEKPWVDPEEREKKRNKAFVICFVLFMTVCFWWGALASNKIEIAGETFSRRETNIFLYKKHISDGDINSIGMMGETRIISLDECTVDAKDLSKIAVGTLQTLILKDCNLTKEQLATIDLSKKRLDTLEITGCQLDSLDFIKGQAESLTRLKISNTNVSDISVLENFTELYEFEADNCKIKDISALANCKKLSTLGLAGNEIETLTPLENHEKITRLDVSGNRLKNLDGIEKCLYLTTISADNNEIENINGLINATKLISVSLNGNKISDISLLEKSAETLQKVYLADNNIADPSCLGKCEGIRYLNLAGNNITDIKWTENLRSIDGLNLADNELTGRLEIENLPELTYLVLSRNKITDFAGKLKNETRALLMLDGNKLENFDVDYAGSYEMLLLGDTGLEDFESIYKAKGSLMVDYSEKLDLDKLKAAGYNKIVFIGVPLDKQVAVKEKLSSVYLEFVDKMEYEADKLIPDSLKGI
ncbi:MAG: TIR domain-containing protein [Clostridia bacterium]|nr:TIR domain-containing protein [Clostridia bacterium]